MRRTSLSIFALTAATFVVSLFDVNTASAGTFVFTGPTQTDDTNLISAFPTSDFGGAGQLDVGTTSGIRHSLIRFNISLPANEILSGATLQFTANLDPIGTFTNAPINVHLVSVANADWVDGSGSTIGVAADGVATWNNKAHSNSPPVPPAAAWAGSAGLNTAGTDYVTTPIATFTASSTDLAGTVYTIPISDVSFIQNWLTNPSQNGGFLLLSPTLEAGADLVRLGQSHTASASVLTLETTLVPEPSTALLLGLSLIGTLRHTRRRRK